MGDAVIYKAEGRVAALTLNRPDKFNCISSSLLEGIESGIEQAEKDSGIRVIVIKALGKHFCTGADLKEVKEHSQTRESLDDFIGYGHLVMQKLEASPLPVIAEVNGYCLAGGLELMMCADVVIAAEDARIGCQHAQYGLVPGWGGTQRLPRIVGMRRALDLMYSARWLTAAEALDWGLVNQVVISSSLSSATFEYADKLASRNPEALAAMKQLARQGVDLSLDEALALEQNLAVPALMSENVAEGLKAFREKREPVFK
ncbi:MAG: enoyl-CoA hydratase/isomerase family protein [bacterium]|nr:enoyl-CoA hydratase/isomerase family protein [Gammaproteobacteria bacterium]HIL96026.1 enoyl-CoA hydratase/isomerase family protein [Pseudomonadales bacterium]